MLSPGVITAAKKATREAKMIKVPERDDLSGGSMALLNIGEYLSLRHPLPVYHVISPIRRKPEKYSAVLESNGYLIYD
jgi:hypothetical protein